MDQTATMQTASNPETVTTADLLSSQLHGPQVREVGTRTLTIGEAPIALVTNDVARLNPITATSAAEMPALEMLAALTGHDPTGIMVIESVAGSDDAAFSIERGRIVGARTPGPLGDLRTWAKEFFRRFPDRVTTPPPGETHTPGAEWVRLARDYVRELTLSALSTATKPGARITLLRGDVTWKGPSLPFEEGLGLQHLLLERARRDDELPRILAKLGNLEQLVLPMSPPSSMPPGGKPTPNGDAEDWGNAQPDDATMAAWDTAHMLYPLCNGERSMAEIIERGLLGRFRTLEGLILLARSQSVIIAAAPAEPAPEKAAKLLHLPSSRPSAQTQSRPRVRRDSRPVTGYMLAQRGQARLGPIQRMPMTSPPDRASRIPTRTRVEPHENVITPKPPSVRNENVGGGRTLLDALEAEIATLDQAEPSEAPAPAPRGVPTQYIILTIVGSLLFAAGAGFSMLFQ